MMDLHLPSEITTQILSMLPVRSVLCCRSVCKTWLNITDDHRFAYLQFIRSSIQEEESGNNNKPIITTFLFLGTSNDYDDAMYIAELDQENINTFKTTKIKFTSSPQLSNHLYYKPYANGLICFTSRNYLIYICNPATQEYVHFPDYYPAQKRFLGFGFDHTNNEFKMVRIALSCKNAIDDYSITAHAITVGSDSWRTIENVPQVICSESSATVQASIHWLTHDIDGNLSSLILSFNLASENFNFIELPRSYFEPAGMREENFRIMNYGGCLSVVDFSYGDCILLWILKEYNVKDSWTKLFVMRGNVITGVNYMWIYPISPLKDGEILLLIDSRKIVSYNFESGRYILFQIDGLPENYNLNDDRMQHHHYDVRPYVGNLL